MWLRTRSRPIRYPVTSPKPISPRATIRPAAEGDTAVFPRRSAASINADVWCAPRSTSSPSAGITTRRSRTSSAARTRAAPRSTRSSTTVKTRCTAHCKLASASLLDTMRDKLEHASFGDNLTEVGVPRVRRLSRRRSRGRPGDPARRGRHVARGERVAEPHPARARRRDPRPLGALRRAGRGQSAGSRDLRRGLRHTLRVDGASRRDEPARRGSRSRARARDRDRSRPGVTSRRSEARHRHSRAHAVAARARALGGDGVVRRHRRHRAGGGPTRLPPLHLQ